LSEVAFGKGGTHAKQSTHAPAREQYPGQAASGAWLSPRPPKGLAKPRSLAPHCSQRVSAHYRASIVRDARSTLQPRSEWFWP
jgi:hypothetical protein